MEEEELQQLVSKDNGEEFLQQLFEERVCNVNVIPHHPRSRTKAMMKRKGKVPTKKQVERLVKKNIVSKAKESQKML
jgi:hypothetical protein